MENSERKPARRRFLLAAANAGMFGAALFAARRAVTVEAASAAPAPAEPSVGAGYHETEHIRKYYRCARYW